MKTKIAAWILSIFTIASFSSLAAEQKSSLSDPNQPFFDAIRKGNTAELKQRIKQNPELARASDQKGRTAILYAVYAGHKEIAEMFISSGVDPNIFEEAATGRIDRARELLDKDPQLVRAYSPDGWTALHLANFDSVEMVKLRVDRGADINAVSKNNLVATPLQGTVVMKKIDFGRFLLDRGANASPRGEEGQAHCTKRPALVNWSLRNF